MGRDDDTLLHVRWGKLGSGKWHGVFLGDKMPQGLLLSMWLLKIDQIIYEESPRH